MDALKKTFEEQAEAAVIVACITAGFLTFEDTVLILLAMRVGGVNVVGLGVPFSNAGSDSAAVQTHHSVRTRGRGRLSSGPTNVGGDQTWGSS